MRTCNLCDTEKPDEEMVKNRNRCLTCNSEWYKEWYQRNKAKELERAKSNKKKIRQSNRDKLVEYLMQNPCSDCGEADIIVLEFDHLSDKVCDVSKLLHYSYSWTRIYQEIQKCEVVCCNCHRRRTSLRSGSWRLAQ